MKAVTITNVIIASSPATIPPTTLVSPVSEDVIWSSRVKRRGSERTLAPG